MLPSAAAVTLYYLHVLILKLRTKHKTFTPFFPFIVSFSLFDLATLIPLNLKIGPSSGRAAAELQNVPFLRNYLG